MKFLKTLLWVMIAVLLAILAARNWRDVTIHLWGDLLVDIKIPVLLTLMFLAGFLPLWLANRFRRWGESRRGSVAAPATLPADAEENEPA